MTQFAQRFEIGRKVAAELGVSALRPSKSELQSAALSLGLSVKEARAALSAFIWN